MSDNSEANNVEQTASTPVASEQPTITKKDPKKVEQGKRLAAISREAKERKLRQKIENELKQNSVDYSKYLVPAVSVVGVFTFFYLWGSRKHNDNNVDIQPVQQEQQQPPAPSTPPKQPKKFESFVE